METASMDHCDHVTNETSTVWERSKREYTLLCDDCLNDRLPLGIPDPVSETVRQRQELLEKVLHLARQLPNHYASRDLVTAEKTVSDVHARLVAFFQADHESSPCDYVNDEIAAEDGVRFEVLQKLLWLLKSHSALLTR